VFPNAQELMETVYGWYKAVGLNVELKMYDLAQWRTFNAKPFPADRGPNLLQAGHDNATGDAAATVPNRHSCNGINSAFCDPELDKQIVAAGLLAGEPRYAAYREIARHLYEESVDYVFFVHLVNFARVNPRINYTPNVLTNTKIRLEDITFNGP
jgi:peptide/nickel transport system substrate-binding protein